jgi:hypothetical protein
MLVFSVRSPDAIDFFGVRARMSSMESLYQGGHPWTCPPPPPRARPGGCASHLVARSSPTCGDEITLLAPSLIRARIASIPSAGTVTVARHLPGFGVAVSPDLGPGLRRPPEAEDRIELFRVAMRSRGTIETR